MSRRSSRSCSDGLTLVELLVAAAVVLAVSAAAVAFALASRRLVDRDRARLELVESVRAAREFLVTDLRQAGERLADDFPAIEIVDGAAGASDTVIVRRNLLDTVLQVCVDVAPSSEKIAVATPGGGSGACAVLPDGDGDGWPDNLQAWRARRLAAGGRLMAFIYDPVTDESEFFPYVGENATTASLEVDSSHVWTRGYAASDAPRLYVLEERRYAIDDGVLRVVIDRDAARGLAVADRLTDLQATAVLRDGTRLDRLGPADRWSSLRSVELELAAELDLRGTTLERRWQGSVLPRNVLSR